MKRLHTFVLKSFVGPLFLTFFIVLFVLIMQFLWRYIDDLVGKGLELSILSELLFYFSVSFVPLALPLAILLAALMTFGNLGENLELTALKSAGISLQRIMTPLVILVILISVGAFFFSNNVMPRANLKSRSLLWDIKNQRPELNIKPGAFYNGIDGFSVKIARKDPKTNLMRKVLIYDHTQKEGNISVTYADSGYMRMTPGDSTLVLTLYNGYSYNEVLDDRNKRKIRRGINSYPHRRESFKEQTIIMELTGFGLNRSDEDLFKRNYSMMNIDQLTYYRDSLTEILNGRKDLFANTMLRTHYFNYRRPGILSPTTEAGSDTIPEFEPFKILNELSRMELAEAVDKAMAKAREVKQYIRRNELDLVNRTRIIRRYEIEWHRRFTLSIACFIFFFIGAPLGAIIRKGGLGMPVVISVIFFVIYYVISLTGEKFVREDFLIPFTGMWISSIILMPIGIFLTYKATADSPILNTDTYIIFLKRLVVFWQRVFHLRKGNDQNS